MNHERIAAELTAPQERLLLEHVDGAAEIKIAFVADGTRSTRASLANLGLLSLGRTLVPKHTHLTEDGRRVLCALLAKYADALVRAGFGIDEPVDDAAREKWTRRA